MPVGCRRVRTGGGPPWRSLDRENAAQGGGRSCHPYQAGRAESLEILESGVILQVVGRANQHVHRFQASQA